MDQKRLLLAFVLSALILFGWSYFFPPPSTPQNNANTAQQSTDNSTPAPQSPSQTSVTPAESQASAPAPDNVPQRTLSVVTPLYDVVLDSRGAVATSWVIKQNKETGRPLYAISADKDKREPLELIPPEKVRQNQAPLRLVTGREDLDASLNSRNYQVVGIEDDSASGRVEVNPGESKRVEFKMIDPATGVEATKSLTFFADSYIVNLETRLAQNGQPLPNAKMVIGPNIGDQGVKQYTFYSVAPEGVGVAGGKVLRLYASSIAGDKQSPNVSNVSGPVDWAGVGDTYFAMALVLPKTNEGLVYRTEKFTHPDESHHTGDKFLITGYVPISTDGSTMYLFTGPKDHDQLRAVSAEISRNLSGRQVDLEELINYGWTGRITRPLASPILWSLKHLNRLTGSYGVAIILFTIIIYTLFFPLKWRSSKSMKKAQKLAPRMKELQEKIKGMKQNDPRLKELQMEQFRLMREGSPLGGCLPILIQMPFLIALYSAITISIDFRQTSFLWMPDLSAGDPIRLLPILMAGSMIVLQLITPAPSADPLQRKMMAVIMPLMMLYILWSAPAGLLVYWLVGNLVGFGQQMLINRLIKSEDDEEPQPPEKSKAGNKPKKNLSGPRVSQA